MGANTKAQAVTLAYMKGLAKAVRQRALREALEAHLKPAAPAAQPQEPQEPKASPSTSKAG
ncbi:MAG: hypothetical protein SFW67_35565 [Myxococcaceae bacterium]|nr:hypothetical protein [Myxococcaceae bacterium]